MPCRSWILTWPACFTTPTSICLTDMPKVKDRQRLCLHGSPRERGRVGDGLKRDISL